MYMGSKSTDEIVGLRQRTKVEAPTAKSQATNVLGKRPVEVALLSAPVHGRMLTAYTQTIASTDFTSWATASKRCKFKIEELDECARARVPVPNACM